MANNNYPGFPTTKNECIHAKGTFHSIVRGHRLDWGGKLRTQSFKGSDKPQTSDSPGQCEDFAPQVFLKQSFTEKLYNHG